MHMTRPTNPRNGNGSFDEQMPSPYHTCPSSAVLCMAQNGNYCKQPSLASLHTFRWIANKLRGAENIGTLRPSSAGQPILWKVHRPLVKIISHEAVIKGPQIYLINTSKFNQLHGMDSSAEGKVSQYAIGKPLHYVLIFGPQLDYHL